MRGRFALVPITALILAGCNGQSGDLASPAAGPLAMQQVTVNGAFMPVSPGNHWTYDRSFTIQIIPDEGPPGPPENFTEKVDITHGGYQQLSDHEYVLERVVFSGGGGTEFLRRQDRAGYYLFQRAKDDGRGVGRPMLTSDMLARDRRAGAMRVARAAGVSMASIESHLARVERIRRLLRGLGDAPAGGPPGGPTFYETTTLSYPLHPGASWVIREVPLFSATVEGREKIDGYSAWRVRIDSELFDDDDVVHFWYSRCGEIAQRLHVVSIVVDSDGTVVGKAVSDDVLDIVEIDIDRSGCDVR